MTKVHGPNSRWAGAIAGSFYVEVVATEDLDIFVFLQPSPSGLVVLTPLYDRLKELGGTVQDEHGLIHGWPVQILPAYTPLVKDAVRDAEEQQYHGRGAGGDGGLFVRHRPANRPPEGFSARPWADRGRLIEAGCVAPAKLRQLIQTHNLQERWNDYARRYA